MGPKLAAVKYDPQGSCVCAIPFPFLFPFPFPSRPICHLPFVPFTSSSSFPRLFLRGVEASEGKEEGGGRRDFSLSSPSSLQIPTVTNACSNPFIHPFSFCSETEGAVRRGQKDEKVESLSIVQYIGPRW